jgi:hypothetical protein
MKKQILLDKLNELRPVGLGQEIYYCVDCFSSECPKCIFHKTDCFPIKGSLMVKLINDISNCKTAETFRTIENIQTFIAKCLL